MINRNLKRYSVTFSVVRTRRGCKGEIKKWEGNEDKIE